MIRFSKLHSASLKLLLAGFLTMVSIIISGQQAATIRGQNLTAPELWHAFFCVNHEVCNTGDFDGDDHDDTVAFVRDEAAGADRGKVWVGLSTGARFADAQLWHPFFCVGSETCAVGDFDGDGKDDIIAFIRSETDLVNRGKVWVGLSTGSQFSAAILWRESFCVGDDVCLVGDFDGDGRTDIVNYVQTATADHVAGSILVALSNGTAFIDAPVGSPAFCSKDDRCQIGDFNGDGMSDLIRIARGAEAAVWVSLANGSGFDAPQIWPSAVCHDPATTCITGDFNGDKRDDLAGFLPQTRSETQPGFISVAYSTNAQFELAPAAIQAFCFNDGGCAASDADGDGMDDLIAFARGTDGALHRGNVWVSRAATTPSSVITPIPSLTVTPVCVVSPPAGWVSYSVPPNATLFSLSVSTGAPLDLLVQVNCIIDPNRLIAGTQIYLPRLPLPSATPTFTPTPTMTPTFTPTCVPGTFGCDSGNVPDDDDLLGTPTLTFTPFPTITPSFTPTCEPGTVGCSSGNVPDDDD